MQFYRKKTLYIYNIGDYRLMVNSVGGFGNDPWKIGQKGEIPVCPAMPENNYEEKNIFSSGMTDGNIGTSQVAAGTAVNGFETTNPVKASSNTTNPGQFDWHQLAKFDTYKMPEVDARHQWMA